MKKFKLLVVLLITIVMAACNQTENQTITTNQSEVSEQTDNQDEEQDTDNQEDGQVQNQGEEHEQSDNQDEEQDQTGSEDSNQDQTDNQSVDLVQSEDLDNIIEQLNVDYIDGSNEVSRRLAWVCNDVLVYKERSLETNLYEFKLYNLDNNLIKTYGPYESMYVLNKAIFGGFYLETINNTDQSYITVFDQKGNEIVTKGPYDIRKRETLKNGYLLFEHSLTEGNNESNYIEIINENGEQVWDIGPIEDHTHYTVGITDLGNLIYHNNMRSELKILHQDGSVIEKGPYRYIGDVIIDSKSNLIYNFSNTEEESYIVKMNQYGDEVWTKGPYNRFLDLNMTNTNGILFETIENEVKKVIQLDSTGNRRGSFELEGYIFYSDDMLHLSDGNFIFQSVNSNSYIESMDENGVRNWVYNLGDHIDVYNLIATTTNEVIIKYYNEMRRPIQFTRLDTNGDVLWENEYGQFLNYHYFEQNDTVLIHYLADNYLHVYVEIIDREGNIIYKQECVGSNDSQYYAEYYINNNGKIDKIIINKEIDYKIDS